MLTWEAWSPVMVTLLLLSLTRSIKELQQQMGFRWLSKSSKSKGRDSDHTTLNTLDSWRGALSSTSQLGWGIACSSLATWAPRLGFCLDFSEVFWKHFVMQQHHHPSPTLQKPGPVSLSQTTLFFSSQDACLELGWTYPVLTSTSDSQFHSCLYLHLSAASCWPPLSGSAFLQFPSISSVLPPYYYKLWQYVYTKLLTW